MEKSAYQNCQKKLNMDHMLYYLQTDRFPPDKYYDNKNKIFYFRQRAADFVTENNKLYYVRPRTNSTEENRTSQRRIVLFSNEEKLQAFYECHLNQGGKHNGKNRTMNLYADKYYVSGLTEMVGALVKNCAVCCQRNKACDSELVEDIQILNKMYGEKHGRRVLSKEVAENNITEENEVLIGGKNRKIVQSTASDRAKITVDTSPGLFIDEKNHKDTNKNDKPNAISRIKHVNDQDLSCLFMNNEDLDWNEELFTDHFTDCNGRLVTNHTAEDNVPKVNAKVCSVRTDTPQQSLLKTAEDQELKSFWQYVEVGVFGPYGTCKKYTVVFLDLYTMWPEVMVVDIVSPTIVTVGLLNLVCRYNIMKKLFVRKSGCIPVSSIVPDIHLLKSADLHLEVVTKGYSQSEVIWKSIEDHIFRFIENNQDWPSSLSFALIPLRMECEKNGSYSLFINNKSRHNVDQEETKKRISTFEKLVGKLLHVYRSCTAYTDDICDKSNEDKELPSSQQEKKNIASQNVTSENSHPISPSSTTLSQDSNFCPQKKNNEAPQSIKSENNQSSSVFSQSDNLRHSSTNSKMVTRSSQQKSDLKSQIQQNNQSKSPSNTRKRIFSKIYLASEGVEESDVKRNRTIMSDQATKETNMIIDDIGLPDSPETDLGDSFTGNINDRDIYNRGIGNSFTVFVKCCKYVEN